jgi:hypothetical protein
MVEVLTVPPMNQFNMDNINQFTALELRNKCASANESLREHCRNMGFNEYPYILSSRATPQQMRGWLLYHFPAEFYIGRVEVGICAGRRVNRGVQHTTSGIFSDVNGNVVAGMRKF